MIIPVLGGMQAISSANNAAYRWMSGANALQNMCSFSGLQNMDLASLNEYEKNIQTDMLTNSLIYKMSMAQEKSLKKLADENIKRSFSTFA